jgi:trehalose 6-phosphate phosphatase
MKPLLAEEGLGVLHQFVERSPLCLFDFDGTLAPLGADPAKVRLPPTIQVRLQVLQSRTALGIVTGRSLKDMQRRLAFRPDYLIGNHGLEGVPGVLDADQALARICADWKVWLQSKITAIDPAIWLEDKDYSLSLHYLHARHPEEAAAQLAALFRQLHPQPRVIAGKAIFNLLPADSGDKGLAVLQLLRHAHNEAAIYVGDDVTDEDVFRLDEPRLLSVRVGQTSDSAAHWYIPDHQAIERLLDQLVAWLPAQKP